MIEMPRWVREAQAQMDSWAQRQQQRAAALRSMRLWPPPAMPIPMPMPLPLPLPVPMPRWWRWRPPWQEDKRRKEELQAEYRKRKAQIEDLCRALEVESLADVQMVLGAMILAESAYKRPDAETLRAANAFKQEFGGGQLIPLRRVQASLEHVPHRYLLAEGGDTLFAAFIGTKQYRDYITDANILQHALFPDDDAAAAAAAAAAALGDDEELAPPQPPESESPPPPPLSSVKAKGAKPAAHRGFLARAKGIPALELYRLAQKKDCNLVLCGHSLGGAVAALATLAILRVFATPDVARAGGRLQIKCITFSQPPVGNAALRDYVHSKGWHHHFTNYCIPEDLIPRLLSPAYFQHYRSQASSLGPQAAAPAPAPSAPPPEASGKPEEEKGEKKRAEGGERMILGVGPLPKYYWRLPRLVPILGGSRRPLQWLRGRAPEEGRPELQMEVAPLEIQESVGSVSLLPSGPPAAGEAPSPSQNSAAAGGLGGIGVAGGSGGSGGAEGGGLEGATSGGAGGGLEGAGGGLGGELRGAGGELRGAGGELRGAGGELRGSGGSGGELVGAGAGAGAGRGGEKMAAADWLKRVPSVSVPVPSLPSYVPFGQLFLLERSSLTRLSAAEYTQLSSVQSVIQELKERFRSHTMRSYRARFLRIYDSCMPSDGAAALRAEHLPYMPHLQSWLGILGSRVIEVGPVAEPIVLRAATALVPLGWTGVPGAGERPLVVDVQGFGLHLCTLVCAQLNGRPCSTTLEALPPPPQQELQHVRPKLQRMRIRVGPPLGRSNAPADSSARAAAAEEDGSAPGVRVANGFQSLPGGGGELGMYEAEGLGELSVQCSTDFTTASQAVVARLRRVRLLGLEGAGKTSLYFALLGKAGVTAGGGGDGGVLPDMDLREGVANGVSYVDAAGVSLQNLGDEAEQLRHELRVGASQRGRKLDLVILVHNLAHKIPRLHGGGPRPALGLLLDEVTAAGIPVVLAITNKFAVSADRRHLAASTIMSTYRVPPNLTVLLNSCAYGVHGAANEPLTSLLPGAGDGRKGQQQPPPPPPPPPANGLVQGAAQRFIFGPMKLVPRPFGRRDVVLPPEGVEELNSLVRIVLSHREEAALDEHAKEQLALQTAEELVDAARESSRFGGLGKSGAAGAAAVGAAFGAGVGVFVAVVVSAAKALRKP